MGALALTSWLGFAAVSGYITTDIFLDTSLSLSPKRPVA
jgi:hypothetical protein